MSTPSEIETEHHTHAPLGAMGYNDCPLTRLLLVITDISKYQSPYLGRDIITAYFGALTQTLIKYVNKNKSFFFFLSKACMEFSQ